MNKKPLLTVFKIVISNYTFRVYDHVPYNKKSRFVVDDNLKFKTEFCDKLIWKKKLFDIFYNEQIKFKEIIIDIEKAIEMFFK